VWWWWWWWWVSGWVSGTAQCVGVIRIYHWNSGACSVPGLQMSPLSAPEAAPVQAAVPLSSFAVPLKEMRCPRPLPLAVPTCPALPPHLRGLQQQLRLLLALRLRQ
jgi:hypothetical protein